MKIIKTIILFIFLICIGAGFYLYSNYQRVTTQPLGKTDTKVRFEIAEGMTGSEVLTDLVSKGILTENDILYIKVYNKINGEPTFKEGTFHIPKNLTLQELNDTLQHPESTDLWVTIPEGLRMDEIATILEMEYKSYPDAVFNKKRFLDLAGDKTYVKNFDLGKTSPTTLEGYLYPDKYLLPVQATEEFLITTFVNTFILKTGGIEYKDLIIASMVEREGFTNEDRPMIADIIKRRLNEGWLLQIDATLLYHHKDWKHVITVQDKELNHAYNTYKKAGLPPTPICNPGLSAINATKNPTSNAYYYYIHDNTRQIHYGRTYQEHLVNVSTYLR